MEERRRTYPHYLSSIPRNWPDDAKVRISVMKETVRQKDRFINAVLILLFLTLLMLLFYYFSS